MIIKITNAATDAEVAIITAALTVLENQKITGEAGEPKSGWSLSAKLPGRILNNKWQSRHTSAWIIDSHNQV